MKILQNVQNYVEAVGLLCLAQDRPTNVNVDKVRTNYIYILWIIKDNLIHI